MEGAAVNDDAYLQTFRLNLHTDTAAFGESAPERARAVARLLRDIAARLEVVTESGDYGDARGGWLGHFQTLFDEDGIDVGRYAFKREGDR
jgi:hypothetical protein